MSTQKLKKLEKKQLAFLGLGVENLALVKYLLAQKVRAEYTICDFRSWEQLGERFAELNKAADRVRIILKWQIGADYNKNLFQFDVLFRSPGWTSHCPGIKEAFRKNKKIILTSAIELFLETSPSKNIIGVTGTKGKGTTSSLIYEIIRANKKTAWLGGNIGVAPFSFIKKIKPSDWVVLELSSFQLEGMNLSPKIAVMTNFTEEHLAPADPNNPNYHHSMKEYWLAKVNIFKWQQRGGVLVINKKLEAKCKKLNAKSKIVCFTKSALTSQLIGEHNKENIAAATEVAKLIGIKLAVVKKAIEKFKGLEHRIEFVRELSGVQYFDDSFATIPAPTMTALKSFKQPIILLAGGAEKKSDFKRLAKQIKKQVKFVVLLRGDATLRLGDELLKAGFLEANLQQVDNIQAAVKLAASKALPGEIVLLSTACASFGMFTNYKERGQLFKQAVNSL